MEKLFNLNSNDINCYAENEAKYDKVLLEPYYHINEIKGKGFRDLVIDTYNHWLHIDQDDADFIKALLQWIHSGSLLVDDMQDSSELRRGIPSAHIIYGACRTQVAIDISAMNNLHSMLAESTQAAKLRSVTLNCVKNLHQGQIMEIYWRDNFICPSEEEYIEMASKKTAQMFISLGEYMGIYSKTNLDLSKLSYVIGIYFQIVDDYRGLNSKLYSESKGFCDDIREGKFIFPIVHAINSRPHDKRISEILKMHTDDFHLKMKCLELLNEFGSMEYTRNKITYYKNLIIEELKKFEYNAGLQKIFDVQYCDES